jgi:riboflavin synthase
MFTGIVEWMGTVGSIKEMDNTETGGKGWSFVIKDCETILGDVILGDSIAVNGKLESFYKCSGEFLQEST